MTGSTVQRLAAIEPVELDGTPWWPLRAVCDALRLPDYSAAGRLVDARHKRKLLVCGRDWRMKKAVALIDRAGVERLVIRHVRDAPRAAVMAALRQ